MIRLTQLDAKLPNLELMKLAYYFKSKGKEIYFSRLPYKEKKEPTHYEMVFGSTIFLSQRKFRDGSCDAMTNLFHGRALYK